MHIISSIWGRIQRELFPHLEDVLGRLTEQEKGLVAVLETIRIEDFISTESGWVGRPKQDRKAIARAFIAMSYYGLSHRRELLSRLATDVRLRSLCGFRAHGRLPHESSFSRAFADFAATGLAEAVHDALIRSHYRQRMVGHISRDATAIRAREKALSKKGKKKRLRPSLPERQRTMTLTEMVAGLPVACDWGGKKNHRGQTEYWKGYKLHVDYADGSVPISVLLTSASLQESQAAIPLAEMSCRRVTSLYDLMDSNYDAAAIREHSRSLGHVPIIVPHRGRSPGVVLRPAQKARLIERVTAERGFARLKDEFGGRSIRVRGHQKVMCHLMFGVLVQTADQLLRLA